MKRLLEEFDRSGQVIMLPWTSMYELTKGGGDNFLASARWIARRPDAVAVARAAMTWFQTVEEPFGTLTADVTDRMSTKNLRSTLTLVRDGQLSGSEVRDGYADLSEKARVLVQGSNFRVLFEAGASALANELASDEKNKIKSAALKGNRDPYREWLLRIFTIERLHTFLVSVRIRYVRARRLANMPSFAALQVMASLMVSFRWLLFGGLESTKKSLDNDGIDIENVLIALYGRDFISEDVCARNLYDDLREMAARLW